MKFSIVTPSYNQGKFLSETIESVIFQSGDFEIEYIVVDNCSTDETIKILRSYEDYIKRRCNHVSFVWVSDRDYGMYDAINKGFALASGDVFAWINADDVYLEGAFDLASRVFNNFHEVKWLKGITSYIDEHSNLSKEGKCFNYHQKWISEGIYGKYTYFIQQDSVFWRSDLWKMAGQIDSRLRLAGDYYLWREFARHARLYSLNAPLSCFRYTPGQLSSRRGEYLRECEAIAPPSRLGRRVRFYMDVIEPRIPDRARPFAYRAAFGGPDFIYVDVVENQLLLKETGYYLVN